MPRMSQPLSQPTSTLSEIRYSEICPWLILVRSLRAALLLRVLLLAFVGVVITQWGWTALDGVFSSSPAQLSRLTESTTEPAPIGPELVEPSAETQPTATLRMSLIGRAIGQTLAGPLVRGWAWLAEPFVRMASREASLTQSIALSLSGIWALLVWSLFGGAIARIAALYLTRGEFLGPVAALRAAVSKWVATAGGPLIVLVVAAAMAMPLALAGSLLRFDLLAFLAALVWLLALIWGLFLTAWLVGLLLGWPLMWATIGVERTDAFDSVSRCHSYVYQRPLHLVFYLIVASVLGLLGEGAVHYFAVAGVTLTEWTVSWGAGNERAAQLMGVSPAGTVPALTGIAATAASLMAFWNQALMAVAASFPLGFLWSAAVGIYLLLRRQIDSTEMDEIALDSSESTEGLPKLAPDVLGVAQVDRNTKEAEKN
jgi:hypothetical protein